jgi:hypothetical protein
MDEQTMVEARPLWEDGITCLLLLLLQQQLIFVSIRASCLVYIGWLLL